MKQHYIYKGKTAPRGEPACRNECIKCNEFHRVMSVGKEFGTASAAKLCKCPGVCISLSPLLPLGSLPHPACPEALTPPALSSSLERNLRKFPGVIPDACLCFLITESSYSKRTGTAIA